MWPKTRESHDGPGSHVLGEKTCARSQMAANPSTDSAVRADLRELVSGPDGWETREGDIRKLLPP